MRIEGLWRMDTVSRRVAFSGLAAALTAACSPLTAFNSLALRDPAQRPGRDIAFGPDPRQKLDVYTPAGAVQTGVAAAAPVMVFFYGGSWSSGRRQDYAFAGQALASRGFVTVVPDYRLVPQVRYPSFVEDGAAAIAWVRDHIAGFGGDPTRIVLSGHSAGAYNAVMLGLDPSFLDAVGVDRRAIKGFAGLAGPYDFLPLRAPETIAAFSGYPDLAATQPMAHARADAPAAFLAHGSRDSIVRPKNSIELGEALTGAGAVAEVKIYPGVSHEGLLLALSRPLRGNATVLDDMSAFLMAHAGAALQHNAAQGRGTLA